MTENTNLPAVASQDEAKGMQLYKVLANTKKVSEIKDDHIIGNALEEAIKIVYYESGKDQWAHPDDYAQMAGILLRDVKRKFGRLTLPEIKEAFYRGARGQYGAWKEPSVLEFNKWINAYMMCEERAFALKLIPGVEQQLKPVEVSPEEKERIGKEAFKNCLASYRKTGIVNDFGNGVYAFLHSHGLVKVTNGDVKQAYAEESERIRKVIADCKVALNRIGVGKAESELMELDRNENISFNLAKKKAVKNYFDSLPTNQ